MRVMQSPTYSDMIHVLCDSRGSLRPHFVVTATSRDLHVFSLSCVCWRLRKYSMSKICVCKAPGIRELVSQLSYQTRPCRPSAREA